MSKTDEVRKLLIGFDDEERIDRILEIVQELECERNLFAKELQQITKDLLKLNELLTRAHTFFVMFSSFSKAGREFDLPTDFMDEWLADYNAHTGGNHD